MFKLKKTNITVEFPTEEAPVGKLRKTESPGAAETKRRSCVNDVTQLTKSHTASLVRSRRSCVEPGRKEGENYDTFTTKEVHCSITISSSLF